MKQSTSVREKVKHFCFGEGEVVSIKEDKIKVLFGVVIHTFPYPQSLNDATLVKVSASTTNPIIDEKIILNKTRNAFFCFQGKQYYNETEADYVFAGLDPSISHWARLRDVKQGDLIFHCCNQRILSISIAQGRAFIEKRPKEHYLANDRKDMKGLMVRTKYYELRRALIVSNYKSEIIKLQGSSEGMGYPFNKNGEGNQGYLFNLNKSLANFFFNEIIKGNSDLLNNQEIQALLQEKKEGPKKTMKLCPICALNWIEDDENCCSVCDNVKVNLSKGGVFVGKKSPAIYFQEEFTFTNEKGSHRGKSGFQAYNSKGENIGIVYMTDICKTPAYGHCELCMYSTYYDQYGEWHRITSHGGRIKWSKLCEILKKRTEYKVFID